MLQEMMEGNEMNLTEMMEFARGVAEKARQERELVEFDPDSKMGNFDRIVRGVARKYAVENFGVEREDLQQDLWVKVLELIDSKGGVENLDEALVAKCCWNLAVDKYRYHRRRRDSKAEYLEGTEDDSDSNKGTGSESDGKLASGSHFQSPTDAIFIKEAIDLFPEGSRERKYIVTKLYISGEIDPDTYDKKEELVLPEDDTEEAILKLLGYNSHFPASWGKKKNEMRRKIYRYLGRLPESENKDEEKRLDKIKNRTKEIFKESKNYYIYTKKLCKDPVLKLLKCTEEDMHEIFKKDSDLIIGIGHESKKMYLMRKQEKWVKIAVEEGDTLIY